MSIYLFLLDFFVLRVYHNIKILFLVLVFFLSIIFFDCLNITFNTYYSYKNFKLLFKFNLILNLIKTRMRKLADNKL